MHANPALADEASFRPTATLPIGHLVRISLYWLGLTAIDGAVGAVHPEPPQLRAVGGRSHSRSAGSLFLLSIPVAVISILVQPTVGSISDYTVSRWGRRKPYIVIGSLLDLVFLAGIALSSTVLMLGAFAALLAFSTNIARGPFQGYVPDLVPEKQVGLASAMVGLMQVLGNVTGFALVTVAVVVFDRIELAIAAVAIVELVTMIAVVARVGEGQPPKHRSGKSWGSIARETWGTDVLQERSYVWLLTSRFFFLMGGAVLVNLFITYLKQTHGLDRGRGQLDELHPAGHDRRDEHPLDHPVSAPVRPDRPQTGYLCKLCDRRDRRHAGCTRPVAIPSPSSAERCSAPRPARSSRSTGR